MLMCPMVSEPHLQTGSGEPLLLLHGAGASWTAWNKVIPLLSAEYDALAPSLGGHAGGPPLAHGPIIERYADSVEAAMDAVRWDTAHICGNSLGGWTAMELARRGRARSVVALSPAGGWKDPHAANQVKRYFTSTRRRIQLTRAIAPLALRNRWLRRHSFRDIAEHGERIEPAEALQMLDVFRDHDLRMLEVFDTSVQPYPDTGVPTLIAWAERDRLVPMPGYADRWRAVAPHAEFRVLPAVGHVPMFDDPRLVADTISDWISKQQSGNKDDSHESPS